MSSKNEQQLIREFEEELNIEEGKVGTDTLFHAAHIPSTESVPSHDLMELSKLNLDMEAEERMSMTEKRESMMGEDRSRMIVGAVVDEPSGEQKFCLTMAEELIVELAMTDAARKQVTGSIFTAKVDIKESGGVLGIGLKDLDGKILTVSMLKRGIDHQPGAAEKAGLRIGDVVFGVNFEPTREGSQSLVRAMKNRGSKTRFLHLQCWRCKQLCPEPIQGTQFLRMDEVIVQAYNLFRNKVLSDWERWNFIEILLRNMLNDLRIRNSTSRSGSHLTSFDRKVGAPLSSDRNESARQLGAVDLERNIVRAKAIRTALDVRVVHTKPQPKSDTVTYVLRVEDVETGLQWAVYRRYRDFYALHEELADISPITSGVEFPQKRLSLRYNTKLVETRMVSLEKYIREVLHILTPIATMDPIASHSLRLVQVFLGVDKYIDCVHPPASDDQRHMEVLAFRFLSDLNQPACQQCHRFVESVDLQALVKEGPDGYRPVLRYVGQALTEVETFTMKHYQKQMVDELKVRRPEMSEEGLHTFVRRCVRRQVESALFLPLRRTIFRIVFSYISKKAAITQRALNILSHAQPEFFMVNQHARKAKALSKTVAKFRDMVQAYLPADQGQLLMHAAAAVMELHTECAQNIKHNDDAEKRLSMLEAEAAEAAQKMNQSAKSSPATVTSPAPNTESPASAHSESWRIVEDKDKELVRDSVGVWEMTHGSHMFSQEAVQKRNQESEKISDVRNSVIHKERHKSVGAASPPSTSLLALAAERDSNGGLDGLVELTEAVTRTSQNSESITRAPVARDSLIYLREEGSFSTISTAASQQRRRHSSVHAPAGSVTNFGVRIDCTGHLGPTRKRAGSNVSVQSKSSNGDESLVSDYQSTIRFSSADVAEDPVREIFQSLETEPAVQLHRDSLCGLSTADLSFLYCEDGISTHDEDEIAVAYATTSNSHDAQCIAGMTEAYVASDVYPHGSCGSSSTTSSTGSSSNGGISSFTPSIDIITKIQQRNTQAVFGSRPVSTPSPAKDLWRDVDNVHSLGGADDDSSLSKGKSTVRSNVLRFSKALLSPLSEGTSNDKDGDKGSTTDSGMSLQELRKVVGQQDKEDKREIDNNDRGSSGNSSPDLLDDESALEAKNTSGFYEGDSLVSAVSADDFLPMFTYCLVKSMLPQLLIIKEVMTCLVADEESYGECGYYVATLEASLTHIVDLAREFNDRNVAARRAERTSRNSSGRR